MLKEKIAKLIDVKSIVTIAMTGAMIAMMFGNFDPPQEFQTLFATTYGAVITYFFTRKSE